MSDEGMLAEFGIVDLDWDDPVALRAVIVQLIEVIRKLQEQLNTNSGNSSLPPASDPLAHPAKHGSGASSGKHRGGQPGHQGKGRKLLVVGECDHLFHHKPVACGKCGAALKGSDPSPARYQQTELPLIAAVTDEHQVHSLTCSACGEVTRGVLPVEYQRVFGPRLTAAIALLGAGFHTTTRLTQDQLRDLFGVSVSLGAISNARMEVSHAVTPSVAELKEYLLRQPVKFVDETSYEQGNADEGNPEGRQAWIWMLGSPQAAVYEARLSRSQAEAVKLLGEQPTGVVHTDRYHVYNYLPAEQRQLCWAHLKRDFQKLSERGGISEEIGNGLLNEIHQLFHYWHQLQRAELSWPAFQLLMRPVQQEVHDRLEQGAVLPKSRTLQESTARTGRRILKQEPSLWTFVKVKGAVPTNNHAERVMRPVVTLRKMTFGSQSTRGSQYIARILSVVTTMKLQHKNAFDFLIQATTAHRARSSAPSLLPQAP